MSCGSTVCSSTIRSPTFHAPVIAKAPPRTLALALFGAPAALLGIAMWLRNRQLQRKALLELDDHLLADVGLTRHEAVREGRKPFWR
jgi:uncharacterized protein YjiS (DUF1127 family)